MQKGSRSRLPWLLSEPISLPPVAHLAFSPSLESLRQKRHTRLTVQYASAMRWQLFAPWPTHRIASHTSPCISRAAPIQSHRAHLSASTHSPRDELFAPWVRMYGADTGYMLRPKNPAKERKQHNQRPLARCLPVPFFL